VRAAASLKSVTVIFVDEPLVPLIISWIITYVVDHSAVDGTVNVVSIVVYGYVRNIKPLVVMWQNMYD
jgi:hypothetical protein